MSNKRQIPGTSPAAMRVSRPPALAFLTLLLLAIPAAGTDLDMLRLLLPGAGNISGWKPSELLRLGEEYRERVTEGGGIEGVPADAIAEEVFAQGWGHDGHEYLFLYRVDPGYAGHLESRHDWKHRELRGGFSVLRTGPDERHKWETVLILAPGGPVYYWGFESATKATLENLDNNIVPAALQESLQKFRAVTSGYHSFTWAPPSVHAVEDPGAPARIQLSSQLTAVIDEVLAYSRVQGDSWEIRTDLTAASEADFQELEKFTRLIADRADEWISHDDEFIRTLAEIFYLGPTTVASEGRTLTLTMTGPKDKVLKATTELDQQREARKRSGPEAK